MSTETIHFGTCPCGAGTVQLFRTGKCAHCYIAELEAKYAAECDASMMAGSQNSALRLQLRDAEERASKLAKGFDAPRASARPRKRRLPTWQSPLPHGAPND